MRRRKSFVKAGGPLSEPQAGADGAVVRQGLGEDVGGDDGDRWGDQNVVGLAVRAAGRVGAAANRSAPAGAGHVGGEPAPHVHVAREGGGGGSRGERGAEGWREAPDRALEQGQVGAGGRE